MRLEKGITRMGKKASGLVNVVGSVSIETEEL